MAEMTLPAGGSTYPVALDVTPQLTDRNRLTVLVRLILAIPHLILVGGGLVLGSWSFFRLRGWGEGPNFAFWTGDSGIITAAAFVIAIIAWFAIVFSGNHPSGMWNFKRFYLRWRVNSVAYASLLRDEYPPFGDSAEYPVSFGIDPPEGDRNRLSVALRLIYIIPHLVVLFFLGLAWTAVSVVAWFAILITGSYPQALYDFAVGVFRWSIRVEAYGLLMRDEYPPFSFDP